MGRHLIRHLPPLFPGAAQHFKPEEIQKQRALRGYVLQWLAQQIAQDKAVFPRLTEGTFDQYKAIDLHMAKQAKLQTPVSLSTLSMEEALNLINEQGQDLILQPMMGGAAAKHLSEVSLENAFSNYTACTLQEYVRGTNCRVIYFSGLPLKAFIGSNCTAADWRDDTTITWAPYELSAEIQNKLHHFFRLSGHTIASVDLIITRRMAISEANTTPSWLDFPEPTHLS